MAELGERLIDNGYSVLPIIPSAKSPGRWQESRGWVGLSGWERYCDRAPKSFELDIWQRWPGCGVGIPCGFIHGVDIDVLDEGAATAIERLARAELGDTPCLRIGLAPKRLLVYRSAVSFPSIKRHPIEVLGHGAQFVGYGIHGETGNPYFWPHEGLDEVHIGRLPEVTEEQCRRFLDRAYEMVPEELRQRKLGPDRCADYYYAGGELRGTRAAVSSALDAIPNDDLDYDSWIYLGLAIKGALGEDGFDVFANWSAQSRKDQPSYTAKTWRGLKPDRLGAGTVYYYAGQNGWVPDSGLILNGALESVKDTGAGQELIAALTAQAHDPETGEVFEEANPEANQDSPGDSLSLPVIIGEQYRDLPRREMVVKGLLGVGELSVTYGAPKTGKSFLLTSCALAIACGDGEWFGHRVKRAGLVIYCIMEGAGGFPNRLAAWSRKAGRAVPDTFVYVPVRLRFLREEGARTPLQRRRQAAEDIVRLKRLVGEVESIAGQPCVLLVVDTVARAMTGRDENSTQDMGEFVDACAELQTLPNRPHVALVHHAGKNGDMRGSSALLGAGDIMLRVEKDETGNRQWGVEFSKDDVDGEAHAFELELVTLYTDDDGDEVTSCVVVDEGAPAPAAPREKPLSNTDKAFKALYEAIAKDGMSPPHGYEIPAEYVASETYWASLALKSIDGQDERARKAAFRTARSRLVEQGRIAGAAGFVWLAEPGAQSAAQMERKARG